MTTKTLSKSDLAQFTGSENWYRHGINRNVVYTDGAQHVAEHGRAHWLSRRDRDHSALQQGSRRRGISGVETHRGSDRSATLSCDDGNDNIVFTKRIEYTDFPLDEITLYFANNVIHLPSEY
jgi:hypothetical protein